MTTMLLEPVDDLNRRSFLAALTAACCSPRAAPTRLAPIRPKHPEGGASPTTGVSR